MEDIVWAINPDHDKLDKLLLRLKDVTAKLLQQQGITYTFYFPAQSFAAPSPSLFAFRPALRALRLYPHLLAFKHNGQYLNGF